MHVEVILQRRLCRLCIVQAFLQIAGAIWYIFLVQKRCARRSCKSCLPQLIESKHEHFHIVFSASQCNFFFITTFEKVCENM